MSTMRRGGAKTSSFHLKLIVATVESNMPVLAPPHLSSFPMVPLSFQTQRQNISQSPCSFLTHDPPALAQGFVGCRIFTFSETGKNGCTSSRSAWSLGDQLVPFAGHPSEGLRCSPAAQGSSLPVVWRHPLVRPSRCHKRGADLSTKHFPGPIFHPSDFGFSKAPCFPIQVFKYQTHP